MDDADGTMEKNSAHMMPRIARYLASIAACGVGEHAVGMGGRGDAEDGEAWAVANLDGDDDDE